jgi:hypothetical protein
MKTKHPFLLAAFVMLVDVVGAQTLNIYTAIELNFFAQAGAIYQVQTSSDLITWTNCDLPIFGNGSQWSKTYSTRTQSKTFYRITTPSIDSGLVGFYTLNGNAYDYSSHTNNGTVSGAIITTDRFGNTNGAFSFVGDGSTEISIPDSPSLDIKNAVTLVAWIKTKGGGYVHKLLSLASL